MKRSQRLPVNFFKKNVSHVPKVALSVALSIAGPLRELAVVGAGFSSFSRDGRSPRIGLHDTIAVGLVLLLQVMLIKMHQHKEVLPSMLTSRYLDK